MKILGSRYRRKLAAPAESPEEIETKRRAESRAELAAKKAHLVELGAKIKLLERKLTFALPPPLDRLLYLPSGSVRDRNGEGMDFTVDESTADYLNLFALTMFDRGHSPWLDLAHDYKTKTLDIAKFEFEPGKGVFVCGQFTPKGRELYEAGRISAISLSTGILNDGSGKPFNLAFRTCKVKTKAAHTMPSTLKNLACMGAILIDGHQTAIQPVRSQAEAWQAILAGMNAVDEEKI